MSEIPILLLGYNRPDYLAVRLEELRKISPPLIYISIDGSYKELSQQITEILEQKLQDWPGSSHVVVWRHDANIGLTHHVTSAISRALEANEKIIIVEDDISMAPNFYRNMVKGFEVLEKRKRLGTVGAFSPIHLPIKLQNLNHWRRTQYFSCWGWGVTREAWKYYEVDLRKENIDLSLSLSATWKKLSLTQKRVWRQRFEKLVMYPLDTWDVQAQYMSFKYDFENILPVSRFVDNVGFLDDRSVHTKGSKPRWFQGGGFSSNEIKTESISFISNFLESLFDSNTFAGDSKFFQWWKNK